MSRFINKINFEGKRSTSERIFFGAMDIIKGKTKSDPVEIFNKCIENVRPLLEVKARRVGGATYQVPVEVKPVRSTSVAMRWLLNAAQSRKGRPMAEKLAEEILLGSRKEGTAFKKREDTHKMAEANRAFAHFKW
jgi:small subunit ribosomal protein S7